MSRHLRRAALAAAAAVALYAAATGAVSHRDLPSPLGFSPSPSGAAADAWSPLSLARAHPDLRSLDALLTRESLLLDATKALSAAALGWRPFPGETLRFLRRDDVTRELIGKVTEDALRARIVVALLAAEDGRFDDALDVLARVAAERPSDPRPRLCAAGICYLAGHLEEGNSWVSGIPEAVRGDNMIHLHQGFLAATLGGAPGAVAGSQGLVGFSAFTVIDLGLWANMFDGNISFFRKMLRHTLLWRGVVAGKYKDYCARKFRVTTAQQKNVLADLDRTI